MERGIEETLNIVEYGLKYYKNSKTGKKLDLLEYFSVTDMGYSELARVAYAMKKQGLGRTLQDEEKKYSWKLKELDINSRMNLFYSIGGHELTSDEKLTIKEKLEMEGYPLLEGVFDCAARVFVDKGVDAISKENVSANLVNEYCEARRFAASSNENAKQLAKTL